MKYLSQLAPVLRCLAACQSNPTTPVAADASAPRAATSEPAQAGPANSKRIEVSMVTVNGQPQAEMTTKQLMRQLGRPDSIAKGRVECGSQLATAMDTANPDIWYYGKTMYEVSGTRTMMVSFDVTTGKFEGKIGKLVLNQNTTLEDVRRFFPVSAKDADKPATGQPGEVMSLPFYDKGVPMDNSLNLLFNKGRLQEVEFFSPC